MERIGILGGTFDPIHRGHTELAETVLDCYGLDKVLFIPAANPPHKINTDICDISHRLQMLQLALGDRDRLEISDLELNREKKSYTSGTLLELRRTYRTGASFSFIIGHEAFLEIETWHHWEEVLQSTDFIVAVRPGYPRSGIEKLLKRMDFSLTLPSSATYRSESRGTTINVLVSDVPNISSTDIRQRIQAGQQWSFLVSARVAEYIRNNRLYR